MMSSKTKTQRLKVLENVTHFLTALVVILKGIDKIDLGKPAIGLTFLLIGTFIVFGTALHHKLARLLRHFKAYVLALETIVMAVVGYLYAQDGKQMIQYACYFASVMFVVALVVHIRKRKSTSEIHFN